ncbi:MAG: TonB-dependent receptor [Acidobacteria bacterium]|nr:TonB-dependent receptor [Acidobacteriota bacterium]
MEALRWLRALGFAAVGVGIVCSPSVHAAETGTIKGTVVDSAKLALPGARVSVVETSLVALTDNSGAFTLVLPPGRYTVIAELSGFRSETRPEVSVAAGETTALAFELAIASYMERVTVTATRTETTLKDVPQNVTVLTATLLESMPITSTVGAFDKVVGLDVSGMGAGIARPVFLSIDGYDDTYIRKMVDGVDVNNRSNNFGLMSEFPLELIERIDVIKGGSSAVWGSGMAGVINVVTKRPESPQPLVHLTLSASHWGEMDFGDGNAVGQSGSYGKAAVDVSQRIGQAGYFLYASYLNSGGFLEHTIERLGKFAGKFSYDFAPKRYAEVFVSNTNTNSEGGHIFAAYPGTPLFFWNYLDDTKIRNTISTIRYVDDSRERLQFNATGKLSSYTFDLTRTKP